MEIKPLLVHTFNHVGVDYRADLVETGEDNESLDSWELVHFHSEGETFENPFRISTGFAYVRPIHISLAEYTAQLIKGGAEERDAAILAIHDQREMFIHDYTKVELAFNVSASYADIQIFNNKRLGNSFSWSKNDGIDLSDYAIENLNEDMIDIIKYTEARAINIISTLSTVFGVNKK